MVDQLQVILDAEGAARQEFNTAREESAQLVHQAEAEAREQRRAAREAREAITRTVEDRIVEDAHRQADRILAEAQTAADAMRAEAQPRMAQAVEAATRCVLASEGDDGR